MVFGLEQRLHRWDEIALSTLGSAHRAIFALFSDFSMLTPVINPRIVNNY